MKKTLNILQAAGRRTFAGLAAAAAFALFAQPASAAVSVDHVEIGNGTTLTMNGGTVHFKVFLSHDLTADVTGGVPYIVLDKISNFASSATPHRADFVGDGRAQDDGPSCLYFDYVIQAGDYSTGVDLTGVLQLDGATISTTGGVVPANVALPKGNDSGSLADGGYELRINTFYFQGGVTQVTAPPSKCKVGKVFSQTVYTGGGSLSGTVHFDVFVDCDDEDASVKVGSQADGSDAVLLSPGSGVFDATMTSSSMTLYVFPQTAAQDVKVRIRPAQSAGSSDADLVIVMDEVFDNIPVITRVVALADGDYTAVGSTIRICVEFDETITGVTGKPFLPLNVQNQNNNAVYAASNPYANYAVYDTGWGFTGTRVYFKYTVKAGDYVGDLDASELNLDNGSSIRYGAAMPITGATLQTFPTGAAAGSLASSSDVSIHTIFFENGTRTITETIVEDVIKTYTVMRGAADPKAQNFTIYATPPSGDKASVPNVFSIDAGQGLGSFAIQALEAGMQEIRIHPNGYAAGDTGGDLVVNLTITPSPTPPAIRISGRGEIVEGSPTDSNGAPYEYAVSLSKPPKTDITVTVSSSDPVGLPIVDCDRTVGSIESGNAVLVFQAGLAGPYTITVDPRDGHAAGVDVVNLTATANMTFAQKVYAVKVVNVAPKFNEAMLDAEGSWTIPPRAAMSPGVISWSASDVSAIDLAAGLVATVDFGDGSPAATVACSSGGSGSATHVYQQANSAGYTVTVSVEDKDGGLATIFGTVVVSAPTTALVQEYKRLGTGAYRNTYSGVDGDRGAMQGMGEGRIVDDQGTTRISVHPNCDWKMFYNPGCGAVAFLSEPLDFTDENGDTINSFTHVWMGEGYVNKASATDPTRHISSALVNVTEELTSFVVEGVFSRERHWEDGFADIDWDELPDEWEEMMWPGQLAFESIGGTAEAPHGHDDNPDYDFLPACVAGVDPVTGDFLLGAGVGADGVSLPSSVGFAPAGLPFVNAYEVRGTHYGLNAVSPRVAGTGVHYVATSVYKPGVSPASPGAESNLVYCVTNEVVRLDPALAAAGLGVPVPTGASSYQTYVGDDAAKVYNWAVPVAPFDEPRFGSYDAAYNFIDGGGLFHPFSGTDPRKADTDDDGLPDGYEYFFWRRARFARTALGYRYDPVLVCESTNAIPNAEIEAVFNPCVPSLHMTLDTDHDGLSNFEEMLLGTNPVHWDTDGDGMNDGWETMWGLDPLNAVDATGNPDGDYMAYLSNGDVTVVETNVVAVYTQEGTNVFVFYSTNIVSYVISGELRHYDVRLACGFDPRTAWKGKVLDRDRKRSFDAPNTKPFSNWEEHYLARWSIDHGLVAEVGPMSGLFMTQPVPYGTRRVYKPEVKDAALKVSHAKTSSGVSDPDTQYTVPFAVVGGANTDYLVESVEIATHGCDSDDDGMPDGWELYVTTSNLAATCSLWPQPDDDVARTAHMPADLDFDGLSNIQECHSTELCEYYYSINTNFARCAIAPFGDTANVNGNWYNKWWPTDPLNLDTDGDHLTDGQEGDVTFRYQGLMRVRPPTPDEQDTSLYGLFGANTMLRGHVPGGGLNPNAVDTDMDYLPDAWEYEFAGFNRDTRYAGGFINQTNKFVGGGMDGTYFDSRSCPDEVLGAAVAAQNATNVDASAHVAAPMRDFDFDHDGLENYQEYWVNAVHCFQYDKWKPGLGYGGYDPAHIFSGGFQAIRDGHGRPRAAGTIDFTWDWSYAADNWQQSGGSAPAHLFGRMLIPFHYIPSELRPDKLADPVFPAAAYASTDPRLADSDGDNMDDFYELFHGLNPILSATVDKCGRPDALAALPGGDKASHYDFTKRPWLAGMPNADPDQDGIPNWEEALAPNQPAPANHNTDPSPLWFTDVSDPESFVNLYYNWGTVLNYWTSEGEDVYVNHPDPSMMDDMWMFGKLVITNRPSYVFSFECNEGFDTDNDNLSDRYELSGTAGGVTDPQNCDRPGGRKALYLDGASAARTQSRCAFGVNALRSWTVEAWVRPDNPASGRRQIVVERPVPWIGSDMTPVLDDVRRTFRLGLTEEGHPFVEFNNGAQDQITECAQAPDGAALAAGRWYHLAATMDGFRKRLSLYVNGTLVASKATELVPYTGFTYSALAGVNGEYHRPLWAPIVVGAADDNPMGRVDGTPFYLNGKSLEKMDGQPRLRSFFKGYVDEIRIWSGARPGGEDIGDPRVAKGKWPTIKDDYESRKRYGLDKVFQSRNDTVKYFERVINERCDTAERQRIRDASQSGLEEAAGYEGENQTTWYLVADGLTFEDFYESATFVLNLLGGENEDCRLPPHLLCCYNFDSLPDPNVETVLPAKFASLNGRPVGYEGVQWLKTAADSSTVYKTAEAPYAFPQYAQNLVAALPLGHLYAAGGDDEYNATQTATNRLPLYEYRADHVASSKFWTRHAVGGVPLAKLYAGTGHGIENNFVNTFPNNANPYGTRYETSNVFTKEGHPHLTMRETFDPVYSAMFNDLVPLRGARADMFVELWDGNVGMNIDSDGDGMPDWWEIRNGLNPYSADENGNGIRDCDDDFDGDGLSNFVEYRASLDPFDGDTDHDGVPDYYDSPHGGLTYGEIYTDNDHVLDSWEARWDALLASPARYDENFDLDFDGWDNWSEALADTRLAFNSYNVASSNAVVVESSASDKAANFPMPTLSAVLHYRGSVIQGARLVVHAYTDASMNGWPDAVLVKGIANADTWPMTVELTKDDVAYGHLRQGRNWFFAWVELAGESLPGVTLTSGGGWPTWTPGEPAAVADFQQESGIDIGWDRNEVEFHLAEAANGFARFSWQGKNDVTGNPVPASGDVAIEVDDTVTGTVLFSRVIKWPRTWIHEGDIVYGRTSDFGLGAPEGVIAPGGDAIHGVYVEGVRVGYVTNSYPASLGAATMESPVGYGVVYDGRPAFRFTLPAASTEFRFELSRQDDGTKLYDRHVPVPLRTVGETRNTVVWKLPHTVGERLPSGYTFGEGTNYVWKITPSNPANRGSAPSATGNFRTATAEQLGNRPEAGNVRVVVSYPTGWAFKKGKTPRIRLQAFEKRSLSGFASSALVVPRNVARVLRRLNVGLSYYLMAYIDQNDNGLRDDFEPYGYYRDPSAPQPFMPKAVVARTLPNDEPYEIILRDPDTDNDLIPDSAEYVLYGSPTTAPATFLAQSGLNDASLRAALAGAVPLPADMLANVPGDADGDGVADILEMFYGLDAGSADTSGDGIRDGDEVKLFGSIQAASTVQSLKITGVSVGENGAVSVEWAWEGEAVAQAGLLGAAPPATITYVVEAADSLVNPVWTPVGEKVVVGALDGSATLDEALLSGGGTGTKFFRVVFQGVE